MNQLKIEKLFVLMKTYNVSHFSDGKISITIGQSQDLPLPVNPLVAKEKPNAKMQAQSAPPVELSIPHHENEVAKLLKLSDEDLVDKLFPDYTDLPQTNGAN